MLWVAVGFAPGRRWFMPAVALLVFVASLPLRPAGDRTQPEPVRQSSTTPSTRRAPWSAPAVARRRWKTGAGGAEGDLRARTGGAGGACAATRSRSNRGRSGAAWAYELDWRPQPVFQNYSAYTSALDRLNAATIEGPDGPERLLRENAQVVDAEFPTPDIDNRFLGWDPPEQARAVLCNFAPLYAKTNAGRCSGGWRTAAGRNARSGR